MNGGRVSFDLILETPLGSVGIFMLPLTTSQVKPVEPSLLPHVLDGITQASACGARCVTLTGLIAPATNYGVTVQTACASKRDLAAVTTGHATTVAAFFFSSRRRHTRWNCDWSSDVCSSDLTARSSRSPSERDEPRNDQLNSFRSIAAAIAA